MKDGKVFADTNIIVYAYDTSAGEKHREAADVMKRLWNSGRGITSTQVLQEFFVTVTKKIPEPLAIAVARAIVKDLLKWKVVTITGPIILEAIDIREKHNYSFWDSMIIASAAEGGAETLLSEDLADGHAVKGVVVRNPFRAGNPTT
jgi:predicted nucleic acid-binding protein